MCRVKEQAFLHDIGEATRRIQSYTTGMNSEAFLNDTKTQDAVVRNVEMIGEATTQLSDSVRQQAPQIPWRNIARMRDKLIHQYFGVNLDSVWQVIQEDLSPLLSAIDDILASKNGTDRLHREQEEQNTESSCIVWKYCAGSACKYGVYTCSMANKRMVLTFGTRRNFCIIARCYSSVVCRASYFRSGRPKGRTCEALALFLAISAILLLPFPRNGVAEMRQYLGGRFCPCASNVWWHVITFPGRTGSGRKSWQSFQQSFLSCFAPQTRIIYSYGNAMKKYDTVIITSFLVYAIP